MKTQPSKTKRLIVYALFAAIQVSGAVALEGIAQGKPVTHKMTSNNPAHSSLVLSGKRLFAANQCLDCHQVSGKGCAEGVMLDGVGGRRSLKFLNEQLRDPEEHVNRASKQFHYQPNLMTQPDLSKEEIKAIVAYLMTLPPRGAQVKEQTRH